MPIRNAHWYTQNETRDYPLADHALAVNQDGKRLPTDIVTDLNLRYPATLGQYAFIASVAVTLNLVTVTLQAAADLDDASTFVPLAVVSVPQPVQQGRHYALQAQYPGVGGWIVFGGGVAKAYTGRFAPRAGVVAQRAARGYRPLPVQSLSKLYNNTALTGVVQLSGESPVEIVGEDREIDGVLRRVAVVRLTQEGGNAFTLQGTETNVFETFAGPCGKRPESSNCGNPAPIEQLNAVAPDCDGNITIEFRGCATIAKVVPGCGLVIDCALGLIDACVGDKLPTDGKLRTDYADQCESSSSEVSAVSESVSTGDATDGPDETSLSFSESESVLGELPAIYTFDSGSNGWAIKSGTFSLVDDDSPGEAAAAAIAGVSATGDRSYSTEPVPAALCLSVWKNCFDTASMPRRYTTDIKLVAGGVASNAALVFNYRGHPTVVGHHVYFLAKLDRDAQRFAIQRFNGTAFIDTGAFADLDNIQADRWYRIAVEVVPGTGDNVEITATLTALEGPALTATVGPLSTSQYLPDTGIPGVLADRAAARFSFLLIEEI